MGKVGGEGMIEPRPYRDVRDKGAMCDLLMAGRKANNGSYYVHPGDLNWWLYYPPLEGGFWEHIHLWDDPAQPERLLGWALISPDWVGFDVYAQPELRGSLQAQQMYLWGEEQALGIARAKGKLKIHVFWILQDDKVLDGHFRRQGYKRTVEFVHLTCSLDQDISLPQVPAGYLVRSCMGEKEVAARARTQYRTFNSSAPFERYVERFSNFMRSPVYDPELDIVVVAPDGQVGAFCIVWTDPINRVGLFEPVRTHPDYQRKGLGKAVMLEAFRRLQERGMKSAIVSTSEDNLPAIKLYESAGFRIVNRLGTYEKDV
jgi:ribosomal protein S18 acetylase RimI-like enzyme